MLKFNQNEKLILRHREFLHDISNPLMVASGLLESSLETLSCHPELEKLKRDLERAKSAVDKASRLIKEERGYCKKALESKKVMQ